MASKAKKSKTTDETAAVGNPQCKCGKEVAKEGDKCSSCWLVSSRRKAGWENYKL